ncbi:MAG: hypothetical protein HQK76_19260 [Desulfobacterales bacterium]|nr:hypothetical protein [Desulfobacterales bacterium]
MAIGGHRNTADIETARTNHRPTSQMERMRAKSRPHPLIWGVDAHPGYRDWRRDRWAKEKQITPQGGSRTGHGEAGGNGRDWKSRKENDFPCAEGCWGASLIAQRVKVVASSREKEESTYSHNPLTVKGKI